MSRRSRFAFLVLLAGCTAAADDTDPGGASDALLGGYDTPDPHNAWLKGVDVSKLAIGEERVLLDEDAMFEGFADRIGEMQEAVARKSGETQRGFHAKAHACVRGELHVRPPAGLASARVGLFARAESYPVWIRYSNGVGFGQPDRKADVRGFAMKVMGVPGKKLLAGQEDATTQDFLMTNGATTPAADARLFVAFGSELHEAALSRDGTVLGAIEAMVKGGAFLMKPEQKRVRSFLLGHVVPASWKRGTLLGEQFWTGGAIALGVDEAGRAKGAAKLTAIGGVLGADGACTPQEKLPNVDDEGYFRTDIKARMKAGATCLDLRLQIQRDAAKQLIEDTSVAWREADTPFVSVGTVVVPETDLDGDPVARANEETCNTFAFTPWHAMPEHRPLGNIMRARKTVYERSRALRGGAREP